MIICLFALDILKSNTIILNTIQHWGIIGKIFGDDKIKQQVIKNRNHLWEWLININLLKAEHFYIGLF